MASMDDPTESAFASDATRFADAATGPASPASPPVDLPAKVGHFSVLSKLGAGGMGVVYTCYDEELDRRVAIKLIHTQSPDATDRFRREAQALARLSHPNVVQVYEVGTLDGQLFLAMEYVKGDTLKAWMAERRDWRSVVEVFAQAGRGLAAAHDAGLVHRDFKPANAMLGSDGRVRVLDFGLARPGETIEPQPDRSVSLPIPKSSSLDTTLTTTGVRVGTPAYMAPEQFTGRAATAKSDQFSFGVALYEGLYGHRPFSEPGADGFIALAARVCRGKVRTPPADRKVPAHVHEVILRALKVDPAERFADMDALLAALLVDPTQARRRWVLALGGAIALAAAVAVGARAGDSDSSTPSPCRGGAAKVEAVWNAERSRAIADAFAATEAGYAEDAWRRAAARVDTYADSWARTYTATCEATRVSREQSEELLDRSMACLQTRLDELDALVVAFEGADRSTVAEATNAVTGLPRLEPCTQPGYLNAALPPPDDPEVATEVEALRAELTRVDALHDVGKYAETVDRSRDLVGRAEALGYPPVEVEAMRRFGRALFHDGQYEQARDVLADAYYLGEEHRHDEEVARTTRLLISLVGDELTDHAGGERWYRQAKAALGRLPHEDPLGHAELLANLAAVDHSRGAYDEAITHYEQALAIRRDLEPDHPAHGGLLTGIALAYRMQGKFERAQEVGEQALELRRRLLGPEHPSVGHTLNGLGVSHYRQGELEEAIAIYQQALAILEAAYGESHPKTAGVLNNLGVAEISRKDYDQAIAYYERAVELERQSHGDLSRDVAKGYGNLGIAYFYKQEYETSAEYYRKGLAIREALLGPDHLEVGLNLLTLGMLEVERGRPFDALPHLERAVKIYANPLAKPALVGSTHFLLARALWDSGADERRAIRLAREAIVILETAERPDTADIEAARAWLEERGESVDAGTD